MMLNETAKTLFLKIGTIIITEIGHRIDILADGYMICYIIKRFFQMIAIIGKLWS